MTAPAFLETSASIISSEMLAQLESALGRTVYPAQLERVLMNVMAYRETLVRTAVQQAAEQCLVEYATGTRLDALGILLGVTRLVASKASATFRITLAAAEGSARVFASGWGTVAPNGTVFRLSQDAVIPAGSVTVDATAQADVAGADANGIDSGMWSPLEGDVTVLSLTTTTGGADAETDSQLRARILDAPEAFSTAGSPGAYRFHALSAHPSITDVSVDLITPGVVGIWVLSSGAPAPDDVLAAVRTALDDEKIRPICDTVQVFAPNTVSFSVAAKLTLYRQVDAASVLAAAQAALDAWIASREAGLGKDLIAAQLIRALAVDGVYNVALQGWMDRTLAPSQWAHCTASAIDLDTERANG